MSDLDIPSPFSEIPLYPLQYLHPSPIHPLPHLSTSATDAANTKDTTANKDGQNPSSHPRINIWCKREDHGSPLACSGNKYRKLEYIVPDILRPQKDGRTVTILVTEGAIQSNHTVQVASVAAVLGLKAVVLLHKGTGGGLRSTTNPEVFQNTGNVQVVRMLGAEVRMLEPDESADDKDPVEPILQGLRDNGHVPYWIPSGASLHHLGGLGYARCAFEIAKQEVELSQRGTLKGSGRFDYIFVSFGSGSTVAGLIAGFKLLEKTRQQQGNNEERKQLPKRQVISIMSSPTKPKPYHEERAVRFARTAGEMIGLDPQNDISLDDVRLDDRFVGSAYGQLDPETKAALDRVARVDGLIGDPVYTGKTLRGLLHWVESGEIARDWSVRGGNSAELNVLFIHTGGQSALAAYSDI
ncbi:hypothetical protein Plec18167_000031 [Paecilomyces lecythidis]|uniref:Tryptophan synthase beta chain-like PALP domain-containing protein n=1 Tax=Paecilomyces lecythidis TaxID=3004212 RepID=A0ABR3YE64_9EURO